MVKYKIGKTVSRAATGSEAFAGVTEFLWKARCCGALEKLKPFGEMLGATLRLSVQIESME